MALASSLGFKLVLAKETVWGTPVAANGAYGRITGGGPGKTTTTTGQSREITRVEIADVFRSRLQGGGSYNFEMSYPTADKELDAVMESLFGGVWTIVGAGPSFDLKVGSTRKSITVEEQYTDIGRYIYYPGAYANLFSLNIGVGDAITGSWGFTSKKGVSAAASQFTPITAANSNSVMNPIDSLQTLTWGGSSLPNPTAFTMQLRRTTIEFPEVNNTDPGDLAPGTFEATGTFSTYVPDAALLADYLAFTERVLAITIGGAANKKWAFTFDKINLTDGGIQAGAQNTPYIQTYNWSGKANDAGNTTCKIVRTP